MGEQSTLMLVERFTDESRVCHLVDQVSSRESLTVPVNDTLSLDLSQSWTPAAAPITATAKTDGVPILNYESLWPAPDGKSFYSFGGDLDGSVRNNGDVLDPSPNLWQFDGKFWTTVGGQTGVAPSLSNVRPSYSLSTAGGGSGYMLGGFQGNNIDAVAHKWPQASFLTYDMNSKAWVNNTSPPVSPFGTAVGGRAQFVPSYGSQGVLLFMGGESTGAPNVAWYEQGTNLRPFTNITIYDIASKTWAWQAAAGASGPSDIPPSGSMFCIAGAQSDLST